MNEKMPDGTYGCGRVFLDFVCGEFKGLHKCKDCKKELRDSQMSQIGKVEE